MSDFYYRAGQIVISDLVRSSDNRLTYDLARNRLEQTINAMTNCEFLQLLSDTLYVMRNEEVSDE